MEVLFSNPSASLSRTSPPAPAPTETLYPDPLPRQAEEAAMPDAAAIAAPVGTTALGPYVARHAAQGDAAARSRSTPRHARSDTPAQGTGPEAAHTDGVFEMSYTLDQVLQGYSKEGRHRQPSTGLRERAIGWYEAAAAVVPALRVRTVRYAGATAVVALLATPLASATLHETPKVEAAKPPVAEAPAVVENSKVNTPPKEPKKITPTPPTVVLRPSKYPSNQDVLWGNESGKAIITLPNGKRVKSRDLSYDERVKVVQHNLNQANVTPEEYAKFKKEIIDLTKKVPRDMSNFNGRRNGQGNPPNPIRKQIKKYVNHFTATPTSAQGYGGYKFAGTMQNDKTYAVQDYINYKNGRSRTYALTNSNTIHVAGKNSISHGVEVAAPAQEGVVAAQYEQLIALNAYQLESHGYINKKTPVTKVVNSVIAGHRELNPNGHQDFPEMVMDVVRAKVIFLLQQLGYKK